MTSDASSSNAAVMKLFQSELEIHCEGLQSILETFRSGEINAATVDGLLSIVTSIIATSKLAEHQYTIDIAKNLENTLTNKSNEMEVDLNFIDWLSTGIGFLETIARFDTATIDQWINQHQNDLESWYNHSGQPSQPARDTQNQTTTASQADPMMLTIFQSDIIAPCDRIRNALSNTEINGDQLQVVTDAIRAIKSSAKLVQLDTLVRVVETIEEFFLLLTQHPDRWIEPISTEILDLMQRISSISHEEPTEIQRWQETNQPGFSAAIERIRSWKAKLSEPADTLEDNNQTPPTRESSLPRADDANKTPPTTAASPQSRAKLDIDTSMFDLFKIEVENQVQLLNSNLLELEKAPDSKSYFEALMRAAHSIKGAARMIGVEPIVRIAHAMEDVFNLAMDNVFSLNADSIDTLLGGVDLISKIANLDIDIIADWLYKQESTIAAIAQATLLIIDKKGSLEASDNPVKNSTLDSDSTAQPAQDPSSQNVQTHKNADNVVRISARRINRLMGLSSELLIASSWVSSHADSLLQLKRKQTELAKSMEVLRYLVSDTIADELTNSLVADVRTKSQQCQQALTCHINELEDFDRRTNILANRLNHEVIASRMRPFSDGIHGFHRLVRDVSRSLGKDIELQIEGENTQVDRDILEKVEAPLNHMLRNAMDHGIEHPEDRVRAGKPRCGVIKLEAFHNAGMLSIVVSDDGRGVDLDRLRAKIIAKKMVSAGMADDLSESELLDFLFLPGFSTKEDVTEISGRGVGLDVVHDAMQQLRGQIRSHSQLGKGMSIHLQLPLTLSMIRALMVSIGGESYAFPLARVHSITKLNKQVIQIMEDRQYFTDGELHIGLVDGAQILKLAQSGQASDTLEVVIVGNRKKRYGIVVERFLGERNLVVHALDPRLGKVKDISSAAITDEGDPTLIIDVDDMLQSIENLISKARLNKFRGSIDIEEVENVKRILVVDDSLTVREVERKLLESHGYEVEVAVDGMDGWNTVRSSHFDLVISDVDMPRMNGIEFVTMIKKDATLKNTPVMIVSYKDRDEDRSLGLQAGADYYLAKGSFHDESLVEAVVDLIGEAER